MTGAEEGHLNSHCNDIRQQKRGERFNFDSSEMIGSGRLCWLVKQEE